MVGTIKISLSWSGGKDSALALWKLQNDPHYEVVCLHTTFGEETQRVGMHGVHESLIEAQALATGLRLDKIYYPASGDNAAYESAMAGYLEKLREEGIGHIAYGDILLDDLKKYREEKLDEEGFKGVFPLWKRGTTEIAKEFIQLGFHTVICAGEADKITEEWMGKVYGLSFINQLPADVDPCGENGEFHTFCCRGPVFSSPIKVICEEVILKSYVIKLEGGEDSEKHYRFAALSLA